MCLYDCISGHYNLLMEGLTKSNVCVCIYTCTAKGQPWGSSYRHYFFNEVWSIISMEAAKQARLAIQ